MKMLRTTRGKLGTILGAQTMTSTVKSDFLRGTIWWDMDIDDRWIVSHIRMSTTRTNVLVIEVVHPDYK